MSKRRTFTRREIMDAARAAAENGLRALLTPAGEIEFTHDAPKRNTARSPEEALEGWLNGRKAGGHP